MEKLIFIFSLVLLSCLNLAIAEELTPNNEKEQRTQTYEKQQVDLLRISPDDGAAFVKMEIPGGSLPTNEEILSSDGVWEKVHVSYHLIYNVTNSPVITGARAGFFKEFVGYRKIVK